MPQHTAGYGAPPSHTHSFPADVPVNPAATAAEEAKIGALAKQAVS